VKAAFVDGRTGVAILRGAMGFFKSFANNFASLRGKERSQRSNKFGMFKPEVMRRLFWIALLIAHFYALAFLVFEQLGGEESPTGLRIASLSLAILFLALKVADIRCLRFSPGFRSVIASITLMAFLHVMAVERASNGAISAETSQTVILAFAGTTAAVDSLRVILKQVSRLIARLGDAPRSQEVIFSIRQWCGVPKCVLASWTNWVPPQFAARPPPLA